MTLIITGGKGFIVALGYRIVEPSGKARILSGADREEVFKCVDAV